MTNPSRNSVFIACSIDGYIADSNGDLQWLNSIPNPDGIDMGYAEFISKQDAIVMGRNTFETVIGFEVEWPYPLTVFVLSNSLQKIPMEYADKAELLKGEPAQIQAQLNQRGYHRLYIDGGSTIRQFLNAGGIDELIITTIPVLLGGGIRLFDELNQRQWFKCIETKRFLGSIVQNRFVKESE